MSNVTAVVIPLLAVLCVAVQALYATSATRVAVLSHAGTEIASIPVNNAESERHTGATNPRKSRERRFGLQGTTPRAAELDAWSVFGIPLQEMNTSEHGDMVDKSSHTRGGSGLVLVVDRQRNMRMTVAAMLRDAGYHTLVAENGEVACQLLRTDTVDIVVTSTQIAPINGFELLSHVKQHSPSTYVIVMTSNSNYYH
jgi:PleD family two-component response regulator